MKDVQNLPDKRGIAVQKVGVSGVHLPILIKTVIDTSQPVLARIKLTVDLPQEIKGTHMSRFIEILSEWKERPLGIVDIQAILEQIMDRLNADQADIEIAFKYFIVKQAPISKLSSLVDIDCKWIASMMRDQPMNFILGVQVPFTSLCPCSKEISDYGAHNQRGMMSAKVQFFPHTFMYIEDVVALLEQQASSPVYSILKREDEKYVTEQAYSNPKFVEDVLRDLIITLRQRPEISWFEVECENFESIHNHNAYGYHAETVNKE